MPAGSLLKSPPALAGWLRPRQNALLPIAVARNSAASVVYFSPVTLSAQERLTSELLRFL